MINTNRLIRTLKNLKEDIPQTKTGIRQFAANFACHAPDLHKEASLLEFFYDYNGIKKLCIDSNDTDTVIMNSYKIAREMHIQYHTDEIDIALLCYAFLVVYGYNITRQKFISKYQRYSLTTVFSGNNNAVHEGSLSEARIKANQSTSIKLGFQNRQAIEQYPAPITQDKTQTTTHLKPRPQSKPAERPKPRSQSKSTTQSNRQTSQQSVVQQESQIIPLSQSELIIPNQPNQQQVYTDPSRDLSLSHYVLAIILALVGLFFLFKLFYSDEAKSTREYPPAPSWIHELGIQDALVIYDSESYMQQNHRLIDTFKAPFSGTYVFTTVDSGDTYGFLSPTEESREEMISDDDSGIDLNYMISRYLYEGEMAYVRIQFLDHNMEGNIHYYILFVQQ